MAFVLDATLLVRIPTSSSGNVREKAAHRISA
jgi:hypothetical protein